MDLFCFFYFILFIIVIYIIKGEIYVYNIYKNKLKEKRNKSYV